jgi:hypothetical protein
MWMKLMHKLGWLENGKIEKLVTALRQLAETNTNAELVKAIRIEAEYFDDNRERMRYPEFRAKNLFVGGVIEAGCKTVIGSRLKQSGMFWTVRGANAIIALRCCCLSGKFEGYWASGPPNCHFHVAHPLQGGASPSNEPLHKSVPRCAWTDNTGAKWSGYESTGGKSARHGRLCVGSRGGAFAGLWTCPRAPTQSACPRQSQR